MDPSVKNAILRAGDIGRKALEYAISLIEPGALLYDVAEKTENFIREMGGQPSFPVNLSINNEAAHYTPFVNDKKAFRTGDLVKVDVGAQVDGYPSDNAATVEVGGRGDYSDLIDATREALNAAIRKVRPMVAVRSIGQAIGEVISSYGFKPVRNLGGHGINRYDLHSGVFIPNYDDGNGKPIQPECVIAIEPFASTGIGSIHDGPPGHIYILSGTRPDTVEPLYSNFRTLPFAERWVSKLVDDHVTYLKRLMAKSQVSQFPVLLEHGKARISQAEHTLLVLSDEVIVTTR
ncbi:type II methionyl aminopeptidase [Thermogymnomonas acidicola]|uniref:Methionine aminopeptidase n=1 Tax=Thermogymnomonas acidicola TaxID=399579 RepID=A0AA37BQB9_9ARCH|nr:type II methionyl aminopeptidase [Thermogymnomonas acidicola]GGM68943.1 type II methionyl aminopeptidase [Thermogymnomonas acidicola]